MVAEVCHRPKMYIKVTAKKCVAFYSESRKDSHKQDNNRNIRSWCFKREIGMFKNSVFLLGV